MCLPGGRSDAELDAELTWLAALARDTGLTVPVARFSTRAATPQLPDGARCIAFGWVQGRPCGYRPSRRLVADLGRVIGTLHRHARGFRPPPGFTRPALDIGHLTWAGTWHAAQLARRPIDPAVRRVLSRDGRASRSRARPALARTRRVTGWSTPTCAWRTSWTTTGRPARSTSMTPRGATTPWTWRSRPTTSQRTLHPVLLGGYQTVEPLPPGYQEHQAALLAARRLYLAIWHLANGLPDEGHLGQLRAFTET